jgi:16S rRNA (guanine527-N7)-methyltransferase
MNIVRDSTLRVKDVLIKGGRELGFEFTSKQVALFLLYLERIKFWNEKINLTGIKDEERIVINHFLDSLTILPFVSEGSKLLDIGSGAGFPGIPIKILSPSLEVTLIDSIQKKVFFMREVIRSLKLRGIKAVCGRAEANHEIPMAYFDFVVSRAVSKIEDLVELCIPYLRKGGRVILMRGKKGLEELDEFRYKTNRNINLLDSKKLFLPISRDQRVILVVSAVY